MKGLLVLSKRPDLQAYTKLLSQSVGWIAGQVELTSECSQRCKYCSSWREHTSDSVIRTEWSLNRLVSFCCTLADVLPNFEHLTLTGGEPQNWPWLDEFISEYLIRRWQERFALQVSTTLCDPVVYPVMWRQAFRDVRVSLDAVDSSIYERVRGVRVDPEDVLQNIAELNHPRTAIITTLYPENIAHFPDLFQRLVKFVNSGCCSIRRLIVLPGMGLARSTHSIAFLDQWHKYIARYTCPCNNTEAKVPTSFAEDTFGARLKPDLRDVPCYVGASTFHIKSNGDLYPCCLVGGEAIGTKEEYRLGNVWETPMEVLWRQHKVPKYNYAVGYYFCRNNCFWKQLALNVETHKASQYCLSMP